MRKSRMIFWAAFAVCLGALLISFSTPSLPEYKGKSLDVWFRGLPLSNKEEGSVRINVWREWNEEGFAYGTPNAAYQVECISAIRALGSNAVPYAMDKLTRRGLPYMKAVQKWANKIGLRPAFLRNPERERAQAATALILVSPLPPDALARLNELTKDNNSNPQADHVLLLSTNSVLLQRAQKFIDFMTAVPEP
jgi:hypothetical protein